MNRKRMMPIVLVSLFIVSCIAMSNIPGNNYTISDTDDSILHPTNTMIPASGESWLAGWQYRRALTVYNVLGATTYYTIDLVVNYDATVALQVDADAHCQTDFDDIRFTDSGGSTELDYWRETYTASTSATFWIEVTADLGGDGTGDTIYIYYGNAGASTTSNGDDTFLFFDDFEDNDLTEWDTAEYSMGYWSVVSDRVKYGTYSAFGDAGATAGDRWLATDIDAFGDANFLVHAWVQSQVETSKEYFFRSSDTDVAAAYGLIGDQDDWYYDNGPYTAWETNTYQDDTWYRIELGIDYTNSLYHLWVDSTSKGTTDLEDVSGTDITSMNTWEIIVDSSAGEDLWLDDCYIRKYNPAGEPFVSVFAGEDVAKVDDVSAEVTNPDDTNNLYGGKEYYFECVIDIESGYEDITYMTMSLKQGASTLGTYKYDEDTDTFSRLSGVSDVDTGASTAVGSSQTLTVTFYITIDWTQNDLSAYYLHIYSYDVFGGNDNDQYGDYDIETRLDLSSFALGDGFGTTDRGNYNSEDSITANGIVIYYGTSSSPPSDLVDVFVTCSDIAGTPWTDTTLTDGQFSMTVDSDDIVGNDVYNFIVVEEGYSQVTTNLLHAAHTDTYIADACTISFLPTDNRIDINSIGVIGYSITYDYDASTYDGGSTLNYTTFTQATAQRRGYTVSSLDGLDTHGITSISTNDEDYLIWDSLTITITGPTDNRINTNANATGILMSAVYDYDGAPFDGTLTLNDTTYDHGVVGRYGYTVASASGDTFGITVISVNDETYCIFDYVKTYLTMPTDSRINVGTNASGISITGYYAYDSTLFDGAITLNDTTFDYAVVGIYYYTVASISGDTYGITTFSKMSGGSWVQNAYCIFDRVKITGISTNSTYNDLNDYVLLTVGLIYEYDSATITTGVFSLRYGTTYLTLTHLAGGSWTTTDSSATSISRTYNSVNGSASQYGITVINMNSKSVDCHWDRIIITVTANIQWTIVGYNITLSYSGTFESNGTVWSETAALNSSAGTLYPVYTMAGTWAFDIVSITGTITGFSSTPVTIIWDDLSFSYGVDWYKANDYTSYYYWGGLILPIQFTWTINGTPVEDIPVVRLQGYINGTSDAFGVISTGTLGTGYFSGLLFGAFDDTWYYANIQVNAQCVINGQTYNWSIYTDTVTVDILHSIHFSVFDITHTSDYVVFEFYCEHDNASWVSVWDTISGTPVLVYNSTLEGVHHFTLSTTIGTHSLIILVNQSSSLAWDEQSYNTALVDDWWSWNYYTYVVNPSYNWMYVTPYISTGEGITLETFKLYVNGSRIYDRDWRFYNRIDYSYEICIKDFFDNELYNITHSWARNIDVLLTFYTLKIYSQLQEDPIHFMLSYGGTTRSEYIGPNEVLRFYVAAKVYTYVFTKNQQRFVGTIDLTMADNYYTIIELDLWDIMNKADNAGGDDDAVELQILTVLIYSIIGLFGVIFFIQIPAVQDKLPGNKRRRQRPAPAPAPQGNKEWDGTRR